MKRGGFGPRATPLVAHKGLVAKTAPKRTKGLTPGAALARTGGDRGKTPQQRASSGELTQATREKVYARDDNRCVRCGREVRKGWRQVHHRVPRSAGGRANGNRLSALITLCGVLSTDPDSCHYVIESKRLDAQAGGWLVPWGSEPHEMPVLYADGVRYLLSDDGGRVAA